MQLWQDGLVAALAAVGLASLLWEAARAVLSHRKPAQKRALALIPALGDGADLQEQIHTLVSLSREQGGIGRILLVDCGLSGEGEKLCRILARENRWVIFCRPEQVVGYLTDDT